MATSQVSAQARGVVVILQGNAWVVSPDGTKRAIKVGDEIQEGQVVITENGTRLELALPNGQAISLEAGRELLIDANLLGLSPTDATEAALRDLNSGSAAIEQINASGGDLSTQLEATAAGLSGGDASDSHSFVRVMRINESLGTASIDRGADTQVTVFIQESAPTPAAPSIASISSPAQTEGNVLVFSVALNASSSVFSTFSFNLGGGSAINSDYGSPTFSNGVTFDPIGKTISVPPGVIGFTVSVPTTNDSVFEGNESVPIDIGGVTGTGTILDNDTPSLVITGPATVNEAAGTLTYTVTLSNAASGPITVAYNAATGT
ncbi:MAG: hypothetical protein RJB68_1161, partial [Pseudomonadota bacterium]